jgi:carbohydrate-selective porin OprB
MLLRDGIGPHRAQGLHRQPCFREFAVLDPVRLYSGAAASFSSLGIGPLEGLNAVVADDRTATTDRQVAGGLVYTGPLSCRPDDDVAFAVGTTHVNKRVAAAQTLENALGQGPVAVQGSETGFEPYHTIRPVAGLLVRPNLQYILKPGGTDQNKDAIVLGLKTAADF